MSKRKKRSDELDAALRADRDYQELCALLSKQTEKQKRRFSQTFAEERNMESTEDITGRILELKEQGLTYPQIAERLNAEGLRTAKGGAFTRTNVQQYVYRCRKVGAFATAKHGEPCEAKQDAPTLAKGGDSVAKEDADMEAANHGESFAHKEPDISVANTCEPCEGSEPEPVGAKVGEVCESFDVANVCEPCEPVEVARVCETPATLPDEWLATIRRVVREELFSMQVNREIQTDIGQRPDHPPHVPRKPGARGLAGERETLPGCRVDEVLYNLFNADRAEQRISASDLMNRILWHYYGKPRLSFEE